MEAKEENRLATFAAAMKEELQKAGIETGTDVLEQALKESWNKTQSLVGCSENCSNGMRW